MNGVLKNNSDILVKRHIEKNMMTYIISFLCIGIGVVLGVYSIKYMQSADKGNINQWLNTAISSLQTKDIGLKALFVESLKNYLPLVFALWFLGLTIIGIPFIIIIDLIKGYTLGFTFSCIISNYAMKGFGAAMFGVVLQNLIFIPCIVFLSVLSMEFSRSILRDKTMILDRSTFLSCVLNYTLVYGVVFLIMLVGSGLETVVAPRMIKYFVGAII